jgi:hypothetical protein
MADLTDKTRLVRDPVAGLRSLLSRIALVAPNPAIIPLRSIGGDSDSLASRWRDCAGNESSRPGERGIGYAAPLSCRSASGTSHNTHCPFGRSSHINSFRADTTRQRDPSARNLCQTMCRCVLSRCFTVTLTANPHLRARAGSHRASSQASFTPTPPLRL